jgi:hypothetical protein
MSGGDFTASMSSKRLEDRGLADRRQLERRVQPDDRAGAHSEDVLRAGLRKERGHVIDLGPHGVVRGKRPGEAPAATVGQVHGEGVCERLGELDVAAR